MNVDADIDMSRTAPTTFCTRRKREDDCCGINLSLVSTGFSFCTKSSFLSPAGGGTTNSGSRDLCALISGTKCAVTHNCGSCRGGTGGSSGLVLLRPTATASGDTVPCTVSQGGNSVALARVAHTKVGFLSGSLSGKFFLVIRKNGVS